MSAAQLFYIIILFLLIPPASAATIHGTVYEWSTFEPLDNALVEVNSTPVQFRVAASGLYSFNLPPGEYSIKVMYYRNKTLEYYSEDNITVNDVEGDFVFDILLFPDNVQEEEFPQADLDNITIDFGDSALPEFDWKYSAAAVIMLAVLALAAYYHYAGGKNQEGKSAGGPGEDIPPPFEEIPLPEDLKEIIRILEESGGRITQKDLRKKLRCSEAKVSLMITDLEARGMLQKIKKGRGNILILTKQK